MAKSKTETYPPVSELQKRLYVKDGILHWKAGPLREDFPPTLAGQEEWERYSAKASTANQPVADCRQIKLFGKQYSTKYVAFAVRYGFHAEYPLHAVSDRLPRENCVDDFFEAPTPSGGPKKVPDSYPRTSLLNPRGALARVVPHNRRGASLAERAVRMKECASYNEAYAWIHDVVVSLNPGSEPSPKKPTSPVREKVPASAYLARAMDKISPAILSGKPLDGQSPREGPSRFPTVPVPDDGYDPVEDQTQSIQTIWPDDGYDLTPGHSPRQGLPPPARRWADPDTLPAPFQVPPAKLDMMSLVALSRFLSVAVRLQNLHKGLVKSKPGATLTLTIGPLDGSWRALSQTWDPQTEQYQQDIRESQPKALLEWSIQESVTVGTGHRTVGKLAYNLRRTLLAKWNANPPSPTVLKAARVAWTAVPCPTLGNDLRKRVPPVQKVLMMEALPGVPQYLQGPQQTNIELVLEELLDGIDLTKWQPPHRSITTTGLSLTVIRNTYGFLLTLRGRPFGEVEEPYRQVRKISVPSKISQKKLRAVPGTRLFRARIGSREGAMQKVPLIVQAILERLRAETQIQQPNNN